MQPVVQTQGFAEGPGISNFKTKHWPAGLLLVITFQENRCLDILTFYFEV